MQVIRPALLLLIGLLLAHSGSSAVAQNFAMGVANVAPAELYDSQQRAVLRVLISNPPAAAVPLLQWESIGLRFDSAPGVPLTSATAGALIASLEIYRDGNANGLFEAANDVLVAQTYYLPIGAGGAVNFAFTGSEPATLQVASATIARFFVVVTVRSDASSASPNTLQVTHLANGAFASTARNAGNGNLLTLSPTADVSTHVLSIGTDAGPTALGLHPVVLQEPPRSALVPLHGAFTDAQEAPEQLQYRVLGTSHPELFSFVGIDPVTGVLTVDPATGGSGDAQITVQASDSSGKTANAALNLHVGPISTYAEFSNAYFGAGGTGISGVQDDPARNGISNLLKYAFFLHPLKNNDRAGMPALSRNGSAKVFTHLRPKYAADLLYTYEKSADLVTWEPAVAGVDYYGVTNDLGDGSQRVECLLLSSSNRKFMRVKVQLTSNPPPPVAPGSSLLPGSESGPAIGAVAPPPPPSTPLPISASAEFVSETQALTGQSLALPNSIATADMDADGWIDLVCISEGDDVVSWYRNVNGTFGPRQILPGNVRSGTGIAVGDLTGDGLPEIVSCSAFDNKIAWYRNLGGGSIGSQQVISTASIYATAVAIADMDRDGRKDVIAASGFHSDSKLVWFRNLGAPSFFPVGHTENPITSQAGGLRPTAGNLPFCIAAGNIDGDPNGYVDIAVASFNDSTVFFLRGNGTNTFDRQVLSSAEMGAIGVALGDMDGDGLKDIVSISAQGSAGGRCVWYRNNGSAPFGAPNIIAANLPGLRAVDTADLNSDGRMDVVAATVRPAISSTPPRAIWFRNLGTGSFGDPASNAQFISSSGFDGYSVATGDFDQNGLRDVAVAWQASSRLSIYRNTGGQIAFTAADTASGTIYESGSDDVLRVSLTNFGATGQDDAAITTLGLLLERTDGTTLTSAEVNQLIDRVHIHADADGSGDFDPSLDPLILTAFHLTVTSGRASIALQNGALSLRQVPPGQTRSFFVVPQATVNGATLNPNQFRITHLATSTGASTARSAVLGTTLQVSGSATNTTSSAVTVSPNSAPTTIGLPAVNVFDPTNTVYLQLPTYFADVEDGAAGLSLRYALVGNSNPALFRFAGIEFGTNRVALKFQPGLAGSAQLSVRASDSLGKSVTTSLQVTVGYTFTDWAALNPPPNIGGSPPSAVAIYAFALNPARPGDLTNAPRIVRDGKVRILRHLRQRWSSDLIYSYEISSDLVNWSAAIPGIHFYEFRKPLAGGIDEADLVILAPGSRVFLRPKAQIP